MQNFRETDAAAEKVVFATKIEDLIGGGTVAVADFVDGFIVPAGSVVGKDNNGLFHVLKVAKLTTAAGNTDTTYQVAKEHGFKVGDFIAALTGAKSYAITAIDTTNADYDILTVGTTLGVVINQYDGIFQASAQATSNTSAFKYTPFGVTGSRIQLNAGDNNVVDIWIRASLFAVNAPVATTQIKAALPQVLWL
ncbi:hypothetical protein [Emticicia sp. BO119]|uniref:hypothetical protein n=1 Tax=Emticicia sp. BO119 TaxID=2757768 RepID=UPI0015F0335A|nr:hypothetical protein [Emticicia sp. BO119]MBA4852072.1 hypothetical protein [Emticicia sp. BO119]